MSRFHAVFPEDRADINLSPMLDVVFIMLIFFIVVATFIREDGIPIVLPPSGTDPEPAVHDAITVKIESEGVFSVNGRVMSRGSVAPYVHALYGENPDARFAVMAADQVPIRDTAIAVDAGHSIGVDVVTIIPIH